MRFFQKDSDAHRQARMLRLKKKMQGVQNQIEFVEILTQFWPLPNMSDKMERLQHKMQLLLHQYHALNRLAVS